MEALIGMIFLLQVVVSIQIMLARKQVLQYLREQSERLNILSNKENTNLENAYSEKREKDTEDEKVGQPALANRESQKAEQEILLQEVLSEVFS